MLQKQNVNINFAKGLNTKTDPWQLELDNFLVLQNTVFTTEKQLRKRNGFGPLVALPNASTTNLTTFGGNLTAIGTTLEAFAEGPGEWINKGALQPVSLSVQPVARSAINQTQCDSVVAPNGLVCTVYTENNNGTETHKYSIQDSTTGQNIVLPSVIPVGSGTVTGSARVFLLAGYFIIVFTNVITSTPHLQYVAIPVNSPTTVTANTDIAASYASATTVSWDGVVYDNRLFIAYNTTTGGQAIQITYLTQSLGAPATAVTFASSIATIMSICVDSTVANSPVVYAAFYDSAGSTGDVVAVDQNLNKKMTATQIISSGTVYNITCTAQSGIATVAYEVANPYPYDNTIETNFLDKVQVTLPASVTTGTVGSTTTFIRSVGLASKAFLMNGTMYMLGEYASLFQPTYFLFDIGGSIISRFAYENGGANLDPSRGYLPLGLPQAQVVGNSVNIAYLFKDLIETTNTTPNSDGSGAPATNNVYAQTGVNLASLAFSAATLSTSEIGQTLNVSGGFLWTYDGQTVNEQGFHVWPDVSSTSLADPADPTPTGTVSNITTPTIMTSVSSVADIVVGMNISGAGIPANTTVLAVGTTTITMSNAATSAHSGSTYTFTGNVSAQKYYYQVTYEWTDAAGNIIRSAPSIPQTITPTSGHSSVQLFIPTLRLSYKTGVKIVIYRWSVANQIYYQVTSITNPLLNDPTVDQVEFTDILADSAIIGNNIIYTTGGVLENIAGQAGTATTLFDDRLWQIDAEDQNVLAFSKQVIEATPVEMSDLLTLYVAPSIGAQGSTGVMKCLAPMDDKLIIFKKDAIYYISGAGNGPDNTGANNNYSAVIFITSSVGCANQNSIVLIPNGIMFQSDKGIWLLGRDLSTSYIGAPVEAFNQYAVNSAQSIPGTTQARFTLSNGVTLMYDYFYQQWGTFVGAPAVSSTLYQGLHTVVGPGGSVSQETPGSFLDNGNPVLLGLVTAWLNMAGLQGYQRAFFFYLLGQYLTPFTLNCQIAYDYNPSPTQSTLIRPTNFAPYYGAPSPYGQGNPYGGPGNVFNWRVFLAKERCSAFQITLQEVYDPAFGMPAGQGLTLSGINLVFATKKGFRPIANANSAGGGVNNG